MEIVSKEEVDARTALVGEYYVAKAEADRAAERLKTAQDALLGYMQENKAKTIKVQAGDKETRFTYVSREVTKIDEVALRKELKAKVFDKFTEKKLNKAKLEAAMQRGEVDPMIVSKHVQIAPGKPYLRVSEGEAE